MKNVESHITELNCPKCGELLKSDNLQHRCIKCGFFAPRVIRRRVIPIEIYKELFDKKKTGFISGFYKKGSDATFSALLILKDDFKISLTLDIKTDIECPICKEPIYHFYGGYRCNAKGCKVKVWSRYRDKDISKKQIFKLLKDKKTDLIKGFRSQKTLRYYNGFLVLNEKGLIEFEFEDREER